METVKKSGVVSLTVGRVGLREILIDSGAFSNVISAPDVGEAEKEGDQGDFT